MGDVAFIFQNLDEGGHRGVLRFGFGDDGEDVVDRSLAERSEHLHDAFFAVSGSIAGVFIAGRFFRYDKFSTKFLDKQVFLRFF